MPQYSPLRQAPCCHRLRGTLPRISKTWFRGNRVALPQCARGGASDKRLTKYVGLKEMLVTDHTVDHTVEDIDDDRRNFIHIATGAVALGGAGMLAYTFVEQWNPAADTRAASSLDVDISKIPLGSEIRVLIGGKPFFIRHRTAAEISSAENANVATMRDPQTDEERPRCKARRYAEPCYSGYIRSLYPPWVCAGWSCWRQYRRLRRLVLSVPRLAL